MRTRVAALMLFGLVVAACASVDNKDYYWKSGMTKHELARDDEQCRQMTTVRSPGAAVAGARVRRPSAEIDDNTHNICMGAYGYEKVPKDFTPPK